MFGLPLSVIELSVMYWLKWKHKIIKRRLQSPPDSNLWPLASQSNAFPLRYIPAIDTREILHLTLIKYPSCSKNFDFYFPFFDLVRKLIFENFSDSVSAQKILLESIGIKRLSAVWATPLLPERFRLGGARTKFRWGCSEGDQLMRRRCVFSR